MAAEGKIQVESLITSRYSLNDIAQGYEDMHAGHNIRGLTRSDSRCSQGTAYCSNRSPRRGKASVAKWTALDSPRTGSEVRSLLTHGGDGTLPLV